MAFLRFLIGIIIKIRFRETEVGLGKVHIIINKKKGERSKRALHVQSVGTLVDIQEAQAAQQLNESLISSVSRTIYRKLISKTTD